MVTTYLEGAIPPWSYLSLLLYIVESRVAYISWCSSNASCCWWKGTDPKCSAGFWLGCTVLYDASDDIYAGPQTVPHQGDTFMAYTSQATLCPGSIADQDRCEV